MKSTKIKFIKWIFGRFGAAIKRLYASYDADVVSDPFFAFLPTFFIGIIVPMPLAIFCFFTGASIATFFWILLILELVWFGNYVRILLRQQYKRFLKETANDSNRTTGR